MTQKMHRRLVAAAAGLMLGLASTAALAASPNFPASSTMAKLAAKPTLRVGVKFDQPLFGLRDLSGKPVGFDIEIAKLIAGKLGFSPDKIEWVETSSANREPFLTQGKVDYVVATYAMNARRKKVVNFAGPYIVGGQDLLVRKGNPQKIKSASDLAGKKACVINGSEGQNVLLRDYKKARVIPFDVISKCVEALKNGSVDAVVTTNFIEAGLTSRDPSNLQLVGKPFTREPWGVGIPKSETDFCRFVESVLTEADKDGTYKKLYDASLKQYIGGEGKLPELDPCPSAS